MSKAKWCRRGHRKVLQAFPSGAQWRCKTCERANYIAWRSVPENRERQRRHILAWRKTEKGRASLEAYLQRPAVKQRRRDLAGSIRGGGLEPRPFRLRVLPWRNLWRGRVTDEAVRSLERVVIAGDESLRPRLEAIYVRTGAAEELEERLLKHVGPWRICTACGYLADRDAALGKTSAGSDCPACDGTGRVGPLRYLKRIVSIDYATLERRGGPHVAHWASGQLDDQGTIGSYRAHREPESRGWLALVTEASFLIASMESVDWSGHQALLMLRHRVPRGPTPVALKERHGKFGPHVLLPRPRDVLALRKLGAEEFSGPLVCWWTGASRRNNVEAVDAVNKADFFAAVSLEKRP